MEWLDWAAVWNFVKTALHIVVQVYSVFAVLVFLFWAVAMWRMIPRMDRLIHIDAILSNREAKAKAQAEEPPLPPRTYAENMADHARAMKRLSEGLEP